jgi:hypothetical protein
LGLWQKAPSGKKVSFTFGQKKKKSAKSWCCTELTETFGLLKKKKNVKRQKS